MRGSRLLRLLLLVMNMLLIAALLLSDIAPFLDPNHLLFPAFFGLGFLPLMLLNICFILFWLLLRPNYAMFGLVAIILSTPNLSNHISYNNGVHQSGDIKVVSLNVRLFDLYNWTNSSETRNDILHFFQEEDADIICLQEYFRSDAKDVLNTTDTLLKVQDARNLHEHFTAIIHGGRHKFGIATFTKYPIIDKGLIPLDTAGNNTAIYTDLIAKSETIRVVNVHLASVHLSALEKEIDEHIERNDQQKQWDDLKRLMQKLAGGYKKRALQVQAIDRFIESSPYPVLFCGDLNDTPGSYAYRVLSDNLDDAFVENGSGLGTSYIGYYPSLRIDFMLADESLVNTSFETKDVRLSDHRPIIGTYKLHDTH